MIDISSWTRKLGRVTIDHSPTILTTIGVVGTVSTAILTGKAAYKAAHILDLERENRVRTQKEELTRNEMVKMTWRLYIPAMSVGALSVGAIVGANRAGVRRAAAMAAAYSISERAFEEYRAKVHQQLGDSGVRKIKDEIAQDRVNANPVDQTEVIITGSGDVLCMDLYTGRYFQSSMEELKKAQNDLNYLLLHDGYASLNDFYEKIGLDRTKTGDEVGWNSDKMLELTFSTTMSNDNRPCIAIDFDVTPVRNYFRTH